MIIKSLLVITNNPSCSFSTGCNSGKWKKVQANILKELLVLMKQTIPQQKSLDLSFNLEPWKWAWHYNGAAKPSCPKRSQKPSMPTMLFTARSCGALLIMPRPLLGCQITAEIKGFLLMYHLFMYYYKWFFQNNEKGWRKMFEKYYFRDFLKWWNLQKKTLNEPLLIIIIIRSTVETVR